MVTVEEVAIADEPAAWRALGLCVEDDACRVGSVRLRFAGRDAGRGIVGWTLRGVATAELDGLPTAGATGVAPAAPPPAHELGITQIDHLVAMTPDLDRSVRALRAAGLSLRRVREEPTPTGAPRQAFFRLGEVILEVIQEPHEIVARAGHERPARLWGLAFVSPDLDAAVARLGARAKPVREAVQPGRRIAPLARSAGLALPVALMTPAPARVAQARH